MASLMENLIEVLEQESNEYKGLLSLSQKKAPVIVSGNLEELQKITDDEQIVVSTNRGEPLVGTNSLAGKAYMNICHRILGEEVPLLDLNQKHGVFEKLKDMFKKN